MGKILDFGAERKKRKPRSTEEAAQAAYRRFCLPEFIASLPDEPPAIASGKAAADGGFIREDEDDISADQAIKDE
ncbi:hypothetical protein V8J88_01535 [Massilia sp. W12]|uniref:hypothetical protein n=1 Tax=Massilia sp. W12 TaxID=3126507 RepID=UPI0030D3FB45